MRPKTPSTVPRMEYQNANDSLNESIGTETAGHAISLVVRKQATAKLTASKTAIRSSSGIQSFRKGGRNGCNSGKRSASRHARPCFVRSEEHTSELQSL